LGQVHGQVLAEYIPKPTFVLPVLGDISLSSLSFLSADEQKEPMSFHVICRQAA